MSAPRRERGTSFHLSFWRVALRALAFFLAMGFGVFVAFIGSAIMYAESNRVPAPQWGLLACCGLPIFVVGLLIFVGMAVVEGNLLLNFLRGEHLVMGENALQSVTRGGKVVIHVPYNNIKRVRILDVIEQRGMKQISVRKVAFVLRDDQAASTVIGFSNAFTPGKKTGEYYIEPIYQASPDQIGKALLKTWQAFQERHERGEAESESL